MIKTKQIASEDIITLFKGAGQCISQQDYCEEYFCQYRTTMMRKTNAIEYTPECSGQKKRGSSGG